jgi:VanZ family protein
MSDTSSDPTELSGSSNNSWARAVIVLAAIYWLAMFTGTHWPKIEFGRFGAPQHVDKVLHFSAYFGLAVLLFASVHLSGRCRSLLRLMVCVALVIALYGLFDEATQPYFNRVADWTDWVADLLGCATGLVCVAVYVRGWHAPTKPDDAAATDSMVA